MNEARLSKDRTGAGSGPWHIRRAGAADARGVLACLRAAFEPYRERYTRPAYEDTVLSEAAFARRLAEMTLFVAVDAGGGIAGTIGYNLAGRGEAHIRGMAVRPDHLGTGVAQRLLEMVEHEVRGHGCARIRLDTTEPLARAIRFYERNGYRASGVVGDFFGMRLIEYVKQL